MNAREILKAWLAERGYDGLWNSEQECACLLGNLAPCESDPGNCEPGYKVTCDHPRCDSCRESGWHMQPQKPTGEKLTAVDNETAELKAEVERVTDLVRYCRGTLHSEDLITDEEYAALCQVEGSPQRLEGYDAMRKRIVELEAALDAAQAEPQKPKEAI